MDRSHLYDTFARAPIAFERGEGAWVETTDGRRLLDFSGGVAVNVLGHAHPALVAALTAQAGKVWHVSNLFRIPEPGDASPRRSAARPSPTRSSSAIPAPRRWSARIKTARRYHIVGGHPERYRIITFAGAFHGRTLGDARRRRQAEISRGLRPGRRRLRPGAARRPQGGGGGDRAGDRGDPDRADPGRGRRPPGVRASSCARSASSATEHGLLLDLRRGADRHRPHRQALRLRMVRRHARHHGGRQGHRRRLPGRRLPRHRRGGEGHDRRAPTARPSAAIRWRWRSARRCSTSSSPTASSTHVAAHGPLSQAAARFGGRQPSRPGRRGARRGPAHRRPLHRAGRRGQSPRCATRAARRRRRRQRRAPAAAAHRQRGRDRRGGRTASRRRSPRPRAARRVGR